MIFRQPLASVGVNPVDSLDPEFSLFKVFHRKVEESKSVPRVGAVTADHAANNAAVVLLIFLLWNFDFFHFSQFLFSKRFIHNFRNFFMFVDKNIMVKLGISYDMTSRPISRNIFILQYLRKSNN